ncbi:MAG: YncE family protein [Gammaproteobacteria bacterium]
MMVDQSSNTFDFSIAYYSGNRATGSLAIIDNKDGQIDVQQLPTAEESGLDKALKPVFVGLTENREIIILNPKSKKISVQPDFPADAFAAHIYSDPYSNRDYFMNDGDKESGNDHLNCGDKGSSVTVIENTSSSAVKFLKTICVGRGHHQATFTGPSDNAPDVPLRAYISNLKDGTLSVIGNDPEDADTYLNVIDTISLCEPDKEESGGAGIPNNAFPHGLAYSPYSGKVYNLNNGYGTVVIIDPVTNQIESRLEFKGHSNLFVTPDGRYIIGRGADRKSDNEHVIAKLTVLDLSTNTIASSLDLLDIYISKYYFNDEGTKLFLTTSSSGSPEQQKNLKTDALLVFDLSSLPQLALTVEVRLGSSSGSLVFRSSNNQNLVFSSNSAEGVLAVLNENHAIVEKIKVNEGTSHSRAW